MKKIFFFTISLSLTGFIFLTGQTGTKGDPRLGKVLFEKNCSSCHGKKGEGLGPTTRMPNFSDKQYQETHTSQQLFEKITTGGSGTGMPAWEKILNPDERWNVVAYIRTLGR